MYRYASITAATRARFVYVNNKPQLYILMGPLKGWMRCCCEPGKRMFAKKGLWWAGCDVFM